MTDGQQALWNRAYAESDREARAGPSAFARDLAARLPAGAALLELGCGPGADAAFFARAGHRVVALDFATAVIARNRERYRDVPGVSFAVADIGRPLPFAAGTFDAVYARLSLHYFPDAVTRRLFDEMRRVLRPGGLLAFMCKSPADPLYGQGEAIEPDMFLLDGKVRHFFDEAYARELLRDRFRIESLWSGPEETYRQAAAVIKVVARAGI